MEVTVALDARYVMARDGSVWSQSGMARTYWERYLTVFETVRILARATAVDFPPKGWTQVNDENILFHRLPDYQGPWQYLKQVRSLRRAAGEAIPQRGAIILRVASQVANIVEGMLHAQQRPYALEVVGDPYQVFAPGVVEHPLRPFFRWHFSRHLRRQCQRASGAAYVTKRALQRRYPSPILETSISDVELPEAAFVSERAPTGNGRLILTTVGSMAQMYKGIDVLIDAVGRCVQAGLDLGAVIVGDGKFRAELAARSERMGLANRIRFTGQITAGDSVRNILDASDLFVLPSRTEGLPKALIEAMARGLPCIGSAVGGIPELLDAGELVAAGDAAALSAKINEVLNDGARMAAMSQRNLVKAREFSGPALAGNRSRFYEYVRDFTENWEQRSSAEAASQSLSKSRSAAI